MQMSSIGENIRCARIHRGVTQEELALALKTTKSAISRYELGKREPRYDQLRAIADYLNVSVGFLQGYEDIDSREILRALRNRDFATVEKLLEMPVGSISNMSVGQYESFENYARQHLSGTEEALDKLRDFISTKYEEITPQDQLSLEDLIAAFSQLNENGQLEAVCRVEELAELRKYRKKTPQD
jgi:transcriptional regulator with XRE-family HTH domain